MSDKEDEQKEKAIDFFLATVEANGVAVSTVSDGFVLMFKRAHLQALLDQHPNEPKVLIVVKQPTFRN